MVFTFVLPCIFFFHMNVSVVFLYSTVLTIWISIPSRDVLFLMMWLLTWKEISFLLHLVSIEVLTSISNNEMYKYTNIIFSVLCFYSFFVSTQDIKRDWDIDVMKDWYKFINHMLVNRSIRAFTAKVFVFFLTVS